MRKMLQLPTAVKLDIAKSYRTYLAKLMSGQVKYNNFTFFVEVLSGMAVKENNNIKTFCIGIEKGHWLMQYSPTMVDELDEFGAGIVIAHEVGHAVLLHSLRIMALLDSLVPDGDTLLLRKAKAVIHLAADYALNSWLIDELNIFKLEDLKTKIGKPTGETYRGDLILSSYAGIHPTDVGLPIGMSMEYYVNALAERIKEDKADRMIRGGSPAGSGESGSSSGGTGESGEKGESNDTNESNGSGGSEQSDESAGSGKSGTSLRSKIDGMSKELLAALEGKLDTDSGMFDDAVRESIKDEYPDVVDGDQMSRQELMEKLERDMKSLVTQGAASCKSRGFGSAGLLDKIGKLFEEPTVSWVDVLRRYAASKMSPKFVATKRRIKRRFTELSGLGEPSEFPGKRKHAEYQIVFAIDTSASVSSSEIAEILTELDALRNSKVGTNITVIECDTRIGNVYLLDKKTSLNNVTGRGGTSFDPVFEIVSGKNKEAIHKVKADYGVTMPLTIDLLIYCTDGECSLPPQEIRIAENKMLWLLSSRGCKPGEWERPTQVSGNTLYGKFVKIIK